MNKAIKYRIYPTKYQKQWFLQTFGNCRKLWNLLLDEQVKVYEETGKFPEMRYAKFSKQDEFSYLRISDTNAYSNVEVNLKSAFSSRFSKNRKKQNGFPKFKSKKNSRNSYTTNNIGNGLRLVEGGICLPKIGIVKAKLHRLPEDNWKLKSATISMTNDGQFFASVLFEFDKEIEQKAVYEDRVIGLDYKSDGLYVDSNGNRCQMPHFYRKAQRRRTKLQRKYSRQLRSHIVSCNGNKPIFDKKLEVCRNLQKSKIRLAKLEHHIQNQRQDFLHKQSTKIANLYDFVVVEDIDMKAAANKDFGNGKATLDNGFGYFRQMLEYKLQDRGGQLSKVGRWFPSSQLCSNCGYQNPEIKNLNVRKWTCQKCGKAHDRDINAAINIRQEGLRMLAAT